MPGVFEVREVQAAVTTELRRAVLRPGWPVGTPMFGDDLAEAVHVAALDGDDAIGACVLLAAPYPHGAEPDAWQLRAMAAAPGRRGQGVGAAVLAFATDAVTRRGGHLLWCRARSVAVGFYERSGFTVATAEYVDTHTGLPHRDMYRRLD